MREENHEFRFTAAEFSHIRDLIAKRAGIKLSEQKKEMVYSRLSRRLRILGLSSFEEYISFLERDSGPEWQEFVGALTTHLTSFFREKHHFPILAEHVRTRAGKGQILLWSCAASTGEEPYSMAMTMVDLFDSFNPPVRILATDVDCNVLETARQGIYPVERIDRLPAKAVRRFFQKGEGSNAGFARVRPELMRLVTFKQLNLMDSVWPIKERYDAMFCRNVMIYFDRSTQERILARCLHQLKPDGLYFAGHSENLGNAAEQFESCGNTVYRPRSAHAAYQAEAPVFSESYA
jgi:chemotaxis protein methyltransferase CheR